jgi:hypothetical protein
VVVTVAVVMAVIMVMWVIIAGKTALTGRNRTDSTPGLPVVAAAILPVAHLDEVVRNHHAELRGERGVVGGPV